MHMAIEVLNQMISEWLNEIVFMMWLAVQIVEDKVAD